MLKYFFPRYMRNTHTKVLAFMFVLQAINGYKHMHDEGGFGWYLRVILALGQGLIHGFKLSSFIRSNENAVVQ
jgi:hypothetical protein